MCECELRLAALEMAIALADKFQVVGAHDVVSSAEQFYAFLNKCDCEEIPEGDIN